ncbi:hypothetical protein DFH06DRAFT_1209045, partial [Mycena polygramma]
MDGNDHPGHSLSNADGARLGHGQTPRSSIHLQSSLSLDGATQMDGNDHPVHDLPNADATSTHDEVQLDANRRPINPKVKYPLGLGARTMKRTPDAAQLKHPGGLLAQTVTSGARQNHPERKFVRTVVGGKFARWDRRVNRTPASMPDPLLGGADARVPRAGPKTKHVAFEDELSGDEERRTTGHQDPATRSNGSGRESHPQDRGAAGPPARPASGDSASRSNEHDGNEHPQEPGRNGATADSEGQDDGRVPDELQSQAGSPKAANGWSGYLWSFFPGQ